MSILFVVYFFVLVFLFLVATPSVQVCRASKEGQRDSLKKREGQRDLGASGVGEGKI